MRSRVLAPPANFISPAVISLELIPLNQRGLGRGDGKKQEIKTKQLTFKPRQVTDAHLHHQPKSSKKVEPGVESELNQKRWKIPLASTPTNANVTPTKPTQSSSKTAHSANTRTEHKVKSRIKQSIAEISQSLGKPVKPVKTVWRGPTQSKTNDWAKELSVLVSPKAAKNLLKTINRTPKTASSEKPMTQKEQKPATETLRKGEVLSPQIFKLLKDHKKLSKEEERIGKLLWGLDEEKERPKKQLDNDKVARGIKNTSAEGSKSRSATNSESMVKAYDSLKNTKILNKGVVRNSKMSLSEIESLYHKSLSPLKEEISTRFRRDFRKEPRRETAEKEKENLKKNAFEYRKPPPARNKTKKRSRPRITKIIKPNQSENRKPKAMVNNLSSKGITASSNTSYKKAPKAKVDSGSKRKIRRSKSDGKTMQRGDKMVVLCHRCKGKVGPHGNQKEDSGKESNQLNEDAKVRFERDKSSQANANTSQVLLKHLGRKLEGRKEKSAEKTSKRKRKGTKSKVSTAETTKTYPNAKGASNMGKLNAPKREKTADRSKSLLAYPELSFSKLRCIKKRIDNAPPKGVHRKPTNKNFIDLNKSHISQIAVKRKKEENPILSDKDEKKGQLKEVQQKAEKPEQAKRLRREQQKEVVYSVQSAITDLLAARRQKKEKRGFQFKNVIQLAKEKFSSAVETVSAKGKRWFDASCKMASEKIKQNEAKPPQRPPITIGEVSQRWRATHSSLLSSLSKSPKPPKQSKKGKGENNALPRVYGPPTKEKAPRDSSKSKKKTFISNATLKRMHRISGQKVEAEKTSIVGKDVSGDIKKLNQRFERSKQLKELKSKQSLVEGDRKDQEVKKSPAERKTDPGHKRRKTRREIMEMCERLSRPKRNLELKDVQESKGKMPKPNRQMSTQKKTKADQDIWGFPVGRIDSIKDGKEREGEDNDTLQDSSEAALSRVGKKLLKRMSIIPPNAGTIRVVLPLKLIKPPPDKTKNAEFPPVDPLSRLMNGLYQVICLNQRPTEKSMPPLLPPLHENQFKFLQKTISKSIRPKVLENDEEEEMKLFYREMVNGQIVHDETVPYAIREKSDETKEKTISDICLTRLLVKNPEYENSVNQALNDYYKSTSDGSDTIVVEIVGRAGVSSDDVNWSQRK